MYHTRQNGGTKRSSYPSKHIPSASQDTNASGIADSTISYGESLRLSQFPSPPASVPTTPILSEFGTPSSSRNTLKPRTTSRVPERKQPSHAGPSASNAYQYSAARTEPPVYSTYSQATTTHHQARNLYSHPSPTSQILSPYDWHDGASSIGMDATEDQLLSTSFITSLLQESGGLRTNRRASAASDALSGFSEMTYPPLASRFSNGRTSPRYSPPVRTLPPRPQGARPPPTAFIPIPEPPNRLSGDSDTIYSSMDNSSILRKASLTRLNVQGTSVVGIMPATLHSVDKSGGIPSYHDPDGVHGDHKGGHLIVNNNHPYMVGPSMRHQNPQATQKRGSAHSTKSSAPSFISRISSHCSIRRVLTWRMVKPLPPVPTIPNVPIAAESEHRRVDESMPLPELVNRAGALQGLLEKGYHPHQSAKSYYIAYKGESLISAFDDGNTIIRETSRVDAPDSSRSRRPLQNLINQLSKVPENYHIKKNSIPRKKKRIYVILGVFLVVALAVVGTAIGLSVHGKKDSSPVCSGNLVGAACDLDATCVCTSSVSGRCDGLAQNLVDLIPALNKFAHANLTSSMVYKSIWLAQGAMPGNNCASQSRLVDVAPALNLQSFPDQTTWARTALLWNLVQSQDVDAVVSLQQFIQKAPWKTIDQVNPAAFSTTVSGYIFNFATREVTQPSQSFVDQGQPTSAQLSQVSPVAKSVLDRMYSFAVASSTQRQNALLHYWTTVLQRKPAELHVFMTALSVSPILLPFNAASLSTLLKDSTLPFPPPLACYPGLSSAETQKVNSLEGQVFGLPPTPNANRFETLCFPDRPIYGVLDVLRLRLPFNDTVPGVARQAAVLRRDASPRVLVRSGEVLSSHPNTSNTTTLTPTQLDPHQYGTLGQYNHVVLNYLSSIPDTDVAMALVDYVLDSVSHSAAPPNNSSVLFRSIAAIPVLEVAVFGSIGPSDIISAVSAFTTFSGSLFFGSDQGDILRNWAISGRQVGIAWAESALSPLIVQDKSFSDKSFNDTWNAASLALHNNIGVSLLNVTRAFQDTNKFTPS